MYSDPSRHSLTFQSYVQLTMTQLHCQKPSSASTEFKLIERSLYSARHCFVENLWREGKLASSEFGVLNEWFKFLTSSPEIDVGVDLVIYLRTTPEVAWQRVRSRARSEEKVRSLVAVPKVFLSLLRPLLLQVIPLEYLQDLHALHEEWLLGDGSKLPCKVLVINVNQVLLQPLFPRLITVHLDSSLFSRTWGPAPNSTQSS
jgi:deoxynucleoside kinase